MLNDTIRIDLHIHSKASSYKEDGDIVRNSDASHIDVLIDKLTENHISLFSITDHNRFDASLYKVLNGRLEQEDSSTKAVLLPGVEFDVELQPGKTPAHMIAIFDGKSPDDYDLIEKSIDTCGRLSSKSDYYSVDAFEKVLKTISLRVILITHQHSGFNGNQRSRSLGKATDNALDLYKYGYIDALEYNSSKIQGILRGELADLDLPDRMLIGTDCHEWEYYPRHDKASADREFEFATVRALPSFQRLLMALTSPKTRIGVKPPEEKPDYCQAIELCGKTIPFSPGLNVIIGENGSGKSSMLNLLCDSDCRKTHVQKVKNEYGFTCEKRPFDPIYIKQGDLQDRYNKGIVFDSALFENPDNTGFSSIVRSYSTSLKKLIKHNIGRKKQHDQTSSTNFIFDDKFESKTFSFTVVCPENFANDDNPWSMRVDTLKGIENMLAQEITNKEYDEAELKKLCTANKLVEEVRLSAAKKMGDRTARTNVKGVIFKEFKKYENETTARANNEDRERSEYRRKKSAFINAVVMMAKQEATDAPCVKSSKIPLGLGITRKQHNGFTFLRSTSYSSLENFENCFIGGFNKDYRDINALLGINTADEISAAIPGQIKETRESSFDEMTEKLIENLCKTEDTILNNGDKSTGNTLGERALMYYKYMSLEVARAKVFVVDQPEDNISNQRISSELIQYLSELRKRTQVILVTHNPLLVVNLDADNVVALSACEDGKRRVISGCLESEDEGSVLQEVANIMDGGKEAIRKRVKVYASLD